jgi:hypothetical protein
MVCMALFAACSQLTAGLRENDLILHHTNRVGQMAYRTIFCLLANAFIHMAK